MLIRTPLRRDFVSTAVVHVFAAVALFAAASVLAVGAAHATTFDFTGGFRANAHGLVLANLGQTTTVTHEGISVHIEAFDETRLDGRIHRSSNGLGVRSDPSANAVGQKESLVFEFSGSPVTIQGLIFERGDVRGQLELFIDDVYHDTIHWTTGGGTLVDHDLGTIAGSRFELRGDRRSFRVGQLAVSSAVPEPSAALLFVAGTIVATRRTRRR